jgi:hypothetical protein
MSALAQTPENTTDIQNGTAHYTGRQESFCTLILLNGSVMTHQENWKNTLDGLNAT